MKKTIEYWKRLVTAYRNHPGVFEIDDYYYMPGSRVKKSIRYEPIFNLTEKGVRACEALLNPQNDQVYLVLPYTHRLIDSFYKVVFMTPTHIDVTPLNNIFERKTLTIMDHAFVPVGNVKFMDEEVEELENQIGSNYQLLNEFARLGILPGQTCCEDCGEKYEAFPMDVTLQNDQWEKITGYRDGQGILCAGCTVKRAAKYYRVGRIVFE